MKTITSEELAARLDSGEAVRLIDVLSADHYRTVHLPGAENIPLHELEQRAPGELERDERIVVYCSSETCTKSPRAAQLLERQGYANVLHFRGGIAEWRRSGHELVRNQNGAKRAA